MNIYYVSTSWQETLARKNRDKELYELAKILRWGDSMPVSLKIDNGKKKVGTPWIKRKING